MTNFLKRFLTRGMAEAQEQKPQKPKEITEPEFEMESVIEDEVRNEKGDDRGVCSDSAYVDESSSCVHLHGCNT